jgi:hypothetical protein
MANESYYATPKGSSKGLPILIKAVLRTHEIDESGDANLTSFLEERSAKPIATNMTLEDFLHEFLLWANGLEWEDFLATAKVGDIPPRSGE